jgi:hypothetical protein
MRSPISADEENVFTRCANEYLDEREEEWKHIIHVQWLWNWTFAILFTLILLALAFVGKSFKELNDNQEKELEFQHNAVIEKKEQDARLANEYRDNMRNWINADKGNRHGKNKIVGR